MDLIKEINTIHAMLAKSSMSQLEYDEVSMNLIKIKREFSIDSTSLMPDEVCNLISKYYGLQKDFHLVKSRKREIVKGRQIACKILLDNTTMTLQYVGDYFGQNHATILHSKEAINNLIETDRLINIEYNEIVAILGRKK